MRKSCREVHVEFENKSEEELGVIVEELASRVKPLERNLHLSIGWMFACLPTVVGVSAVMRYFGAQDAAQSFENAGVAVSPYLSLFPSLLTLAYNDLGEMGEQNRRYSIARDILKERRDNEARANGIMALVHSMSEEH